MSDRNVVRTRNKVTVETGTESRYKPPSTRLVDRTTMLKYMTDEINFPGGENPMDIKTSTLEGSSVDGTFKGYSNTVKRTWSNYPSAITIGTYDTYMPVFPESHAALSTRILAMTAPERQEVLLPAFLLELRDIPRTVMYGTALARRATSLFDDARAAVKHQRDFGDGPSSLTRWATASGISRLRTSAAEIGQANIAWKFGVAPFIADLRTLANFQELVDSRRKEIDRLHSGSGLKRSIKNLGTHREEGVLENRVIFNHASVRGDIRFNNHARRWASIRWKPTRASILPPNDAELRKIILGISTRGAIMSAYELLPWSWLLDYFTNLGDVLGASVNGLTYNWAGSIMTQSTADLSHEPKKVLRSGEKTDFNISAGHLIHERKVRNPMSGPHLSWIGDELTGSQLSILGSLATSRLKR